MDHMDHMDHMNHMNHMEQASYDMHSYVHELSLVRKNIVHLRKQLETAVQRDRTISSYLKKTHNLDI